MIKFGDKYSRQARLYPALIVLTPTLLLVVALFPELLTNEIGKILLTILFSVGTLYFLSSISRTSGKRTEQRLLDTWGGWPTTIWLRHRDVNLAQHTKIRYHEYFRKNVPEINIPTAEEEEENPVIADQAYLSAIDWLKEHRRGEQYSLILEENIQYGFRRNMRGMKLLAILLSIACMLFVTGMSTYEYYVASISLDAVKTYKDMVDLIIKLMALPVGLAVVLNILALFFWLFYVCDRWVREAADQYARALLTTCE